MRILRAAAVTIFFLTAVFAFNRIDAESFANANANANSTVIAAKIPKMADSPETPAPKVKAVKREPAAQKRTTEEKIVQRRFRIEGLLTNLDHVAAVALQMNPDQSDRLEPIIVDLAERTLELVDAEALAEPAADGELDDIESTLKGLMETMTRMVETETTL